MDMVEIPEQPSQNIKGKGVMLPNSLALHHSDTPGLVLVKSQLDGRNYGEWHRATRLNLSSKNKLGLIDGTVRAPPAADPKFPLWQCCNDMVISWILHSIQPEIARSVNRESTKFGKKLLNVLRIYLSLFLLHQTQMTLG